MVKMCVCVGVFCPAAWQVWLLLCHKTAMKPVAVWNVNSFLIIQKDDSQFTFQYLHNLYQQHSAFLEYLVFNFHHVVVVCSFVFVCVWVGVVMHLYIFCCLLNYPYTFGCIHVWTWTRVCRLGLSERSSDLWHPIQFLLDRSFSFVTDYKALEIESVFTASRQLWLVVHTQWHYGCHRGKCVVKKQYCFFGLLSVVWVDCRRKGN